MKLEEFAIRNYRSVKSITVANIGSLNVLIGKNNSGKSNVLSSLDVYFSCFRPGDVILDRLELSRPLEFFDRDTKNAIELNGRFL
jgi:putative ATP-dependent endonuclease of the OLD family